MKKILLILILLFSVFNAWHAYYLTEKDLHDASAISSQFNYSLATYINNNFTTLQEKYHAYEWSRYDQFQEIKHDVINKKVRPILLENMQNRNWYYQKMIYFIMELSWHGKDRHDNSDIISSYDHRYRKSYELRDSQRWNNNNDPYNEETYTAFKELHNYPQPSINSLTTGLVNTMKYEWFFWLADMDFGETYIYEISHIENDMNILWLSKWIKKKRDNFWRPRYENFFQKPYQIWEINISFIDALQDKMLDDALSILHNAVQYNVVPFPGPMWPVIEIDNVTYDSPFYLLDLHGHTRHTFHWWIIFFTKWVWWFEPPKANFITVEDNIIIHLIDYIDYDSDWINDYQEFKQKIRRLYE